MSSKQARFPILIIPGFMSSGLEVRRSSLQKSWIGKRLFINLISLGFEAINFVRHAAPVTVLRTESDSNLEDGDERDVTEQIRQHMAYKNLWIQHMALNQDDLCSEHPGVEVRPMQGLSAVDYLAPGALTDHVSYVFGPLIKALQNAGYKEGLSLDAAPYDWRLPPSFLEERDAYFSSAMETIEGMYQKNNNTPVIILCHSMGCKVGHYLLNFANERSKGWTEKYIHTYMPVGGPHLGAPKALRASITGDKMGLDAFLNDYESLALGRSFGSGPWLIPEQLPEFAPPNVFLRREGAFVVEIQSAIHGLDSLFERRKDESRPKKLRIILKLGKETVCSKFFPVEDTSVEFNCKFTFSSGPDGPTTKGCCSCCCRCCCNTACCRRCLCCMQEGLVVHLCEPGVQAARGKKKSDCCCVCSEEAVPLWLRIISCYYVIKWAILISYVFNYFAFYRGWVYLADGINKATDGSSILASSDPLNMDEFVGDIDRETEVELVQTECCICSHERGTVKLALKIRWISPEPVVKRATHSPVAEESNGQCRVLGGIWSPPDKGCCCSGEEEEPIIEPTSGYNLLKKEGNEAAIKVMERFYNSDTLEPRGYLSSRAPPPVKRVKAIYGINIPTECGAVYKLRGIVAEKENKITNLYMLDNKAELESKEDAHGYVLEGGILKETSSTEQMIVGAERFKRSSAARDFKKCSGDGTVPYYSLQHIRTWEKALKVSVSELEGAEHREILADKRFHGILLDYMLNEMDAYNEHAEDNV